MRRLSIAIVIVALTLLSEAIPSLHAESPTSDWIRGSLGQLEIRLRGEVFDPDGQPANDIVAQGGINASGVAIPLEPVVNGNQFELWIPVNEQPWYSMWLRATSKDGKLVQYQRFSMYQLRQAAIDGIKLTLQRPTRIMNVKVTHQGEPVPNAFVKTELGYGIELRQRTDVNGNASFPLLPTQEPTRFTAWTEDFRVGGFSFNRQPPRDPQADQHEVELSQCRDQKLRFVDQDGTPVPDITFVLQMATMPNYNYIGTNENSQLTTDENGEIDYPWFPDWDQHHFYPELQSRKWVLDGDPKMVDGVAVLTLKKGSDRKRVTGQTEMDGQSGNQGFFVTLRSFQGERENQSDVLSAFSDTNGEFTMDVLPDATYCAWSLDSKWVGKVSHLIPYQSGTDTLNSPTIVVKEGQEIEVVVTSGESEKPYPNLSISFRHEHGYSWQEDGKTRRGTSGPQWWATTNDDGIATTVSVPGDLKASVYTPLWRTEAEVEVAQSENPTTIRLHREFDQKRTVIGKLAFSEECDSSLHNAEVKIASVDGDYDDQQELIVQEDGSFSFDTFASMIGFFAITKDKKAAGAIVAQNLDSSIVLRMRPTIDYQGQLLGDGDQPLARHKVWASVQLEGEVDYSRQASFSTSFEATRIETTTDSLGIYTLTGLPSDLKIGIRASAIGDSTSTRYLDEVFLQPGDNRPVAVSRLGEKSGSVNTPLASRYESMLRDCSLMRFNMMVITSADDESTNKFVAKNFVNYGVNKNNSTFMQLVIAGNAASLPKDDLQFLKERGLQLPEIGRILASAIDSKGNELGRLELDISEEDAANAAVSFVNQHAPKQLDAEAKWKAAFEEAQDSQRVVWARISQRYCGPCFKMARWLDDNQELLSKDYVMLKIDNVRDENGTDAAERLTRGGQHGVPFHVIFDANQEVLVDSEGPLGNIGHPSGFEGKAHVRKMLLETRRRLTDAEINQIVDSLDE